MKLCVFRFLVLFHLSNSVTIPPQIVLLYLSFFSCECYQEKKVQVLWCYVSKVILLYSVT